MKNIWKIFTGDLKKLVKQPFALDYYYRVVRDTVAVCVV